MWMWVWMWVWMWMCVWMCVDVGWGVLLNVEDLFGDYFAAFC